MSTLADFARQHYRVGITAAAGDFPHDHKNLAETVKLLAKGKPVPKILNGMVVACNLWGVKAANVLLFSLTDREHWPRLKTALKAVNGLTPAIRLNGWTIDLFGITDDASMAQAVTDLARYGQYSGD